MNPSFGAAKTVHGAVVQMLQSHHRKVVTGLGESLKGEASAQTHAYLLMSFALFSLPAALLLTYVYAQVGALSLFSLPLFLFLSSCTAVEFSVPIA